MLRFFRPRVTKRLNTVNLGDDLEGVELVQHLEEVCGIELPDVEVSGATTVGQLYDLVASKVHQNPDFDPLWGMLVEIVRIHSGSRDGIDRDTAFFPKDAQPRD
ncbi:MAG: hypothetical protein AAGH70_11540 [Pseudomonadota bacterium]